VTKAQEPVPGADADAGANGITIIAGAPTAAELAALSAVVSALAEELADDHLVARASSTSAWQRSQRALRTPMTPGQGAWRSFSG